MSKQPNQVKVLPPPPDTGSDEATALCPCKHTLCTHECYCGEGTHSQCNQSSPQIVQSLCVRLCLFDSVKRSEQVLSRPGEREHSVQPRDVCTSLLTTEEER